MKSDGGSREGESGSACDARGMSLYVAVSGVVAVPRVVSAVLSD